MRIKRSRIIRLIGESVAESYFGKGFVLFKNRVSAGEDALEVAEDMLQRLGQGSTRVVFGFTDNPGIVLKIINWNDEAGVNPDTGFVRDQMIDSNRWESDLQMQQKYPNVFPRTFEHADDFSWIIAEKVKPVASYEELFQLMGLEDEQFSKMPFVRKVQFQALVELAISYFQEPDGPAQQMLRETAVVSRLQQQTRTMPMTIPGDEDAPKGTMRAGIVMTRRLKKILSNRQNAQILAAMGDLKIPPIEFSPKNVGVSEITGKLVLLDASLWKEYKPVRENTMKITRKQLRQIIKESVQINEIESKKEDLDKKYQTSLRRKANSLTSRPPGPRGRYEAYGELVDNKVVVTVDNSTSVSGEHRDSLSASFKLDMTRGFKAGLDKNKKWRVALAFS